ncbi:MAG: amino acid-binding protein [Propioniciclava sp.]
MRVKLPDRPGSLGVVASALGEVQADISAVEIVERGDGYAVDDFMLALPHGTQPDVLISVCSSLSGVEVMWVSTYPAHWTITADTDVVDAMAADPDRAESLLMESAPAVFHGTWALLVDSDGTVQEVTELGPQNLTPDPDRFGDLSLPHSLTLASGWTDGWGEHAVAVAPLRGSGRSIVLARPGPDFQPSEVVRLRHLALLSDGHLPVA